MSRTRVFAILDIIWRFKRVLTPWQSNITSARRTSKSANIYWSRTVSVRRTLKHFYHIVYRDVHGFPLSYGIRKFFFSRQIECDATCPVRTVIVVLRSNVFIYFFFFFWKDRQECRETEFLLNDHKNKYRITLDRFISIAASPVLWTRREIRTRNHNNDSPLIVLRNHVQVNTRWAWWIFGVTCTLFKK